MERFWRHEDFIRRQYGEAIGVGISEFTERLKYLRTAHDILNICLFDGKLSQPYIDICNISKYYDKPILGCFVNKNNSTNETYFAHLSEQNSILFSLECGENIYNDTSETAINAMYISTLLHEMIHQYCFENNITDFESGVHTCIFADVAEKHGLFVMGDGTGNYSYTALDSDLDELWEYLNANYDRIV